MSDEITSKKNLLIRQQLQDWFAGEHGTLLLDDERKKLAQQLYVLFGYHILQIGNIGGTYFLDSSKISHKMIANLVPDEQSEQNSGFCCNCNNLPVAPDSIDVVVLPHVLEFEANPHQVLRESERVLIGEGHVVILGFNPWSLWGLWRLLLAWREKPPWQGHYIGLTRIKDWLKLLDFEVIKLERFYFRPPLRSLKLLNKLEFMEQLGRYCWSWFGGVYLLVAKKRVVPLTPIKLQWRTRRQMIDTGVAGTTTGMAPQEINRQENNRQDHEKA
ncbi:MAG: methyltransferase domain-containing protein [Gammaproteobacteria bacterium]